jgi:hypothetical protein
MIRLREAAGWLDLKKAKKDNDVAILLDCERNDWKFETVE